MMIERTLFIFAITLPFDIRDMKVDRESNVKTIPTVLGSRRSQHLGGLCLTGMLLMVGCNYQLDYYDLTTSIALTISVVTTVPLIYLTTSQTHDYFISGIIDGTMILQAILVLFL